MDTAAGSATERLAKLYEEWRNNYKPNLVKAEKFSPPLLLNVTHAFENASRRVLVYGQETLGWVWTAESREKLGYPSEPKFADLKTLADFLKEQDSIQALCWGYEQFDFAEAEPRARRTPFWQAFREVQTFGAGEVMWANIVRCEYWPDGHPEGGGTILAAPAEVRTEFIDKQKGLVLSELESLNCSSCVFFTGPDYDVILDATFSGLVREDVGLPVWEFCKLRHESLPAKAYRTYHPGYLSRSGKWEYLDRLKKLVLG